MAFERTGFLVVKQSSTEIFEWDHENEKFVLSPLVQNESRDVAAVVGVSSDLLGCWEDPEIQIFEQFHNEKRCQKKEKRAHP